MELKLRKLITPVKKLIIIFFITSAAAILVSIITGFKMAIVFMVAGNICILGGVGSFRGTAQLQTHPCYMPSKKARRFSFFNNLMRLVCINGFLLIVVFFILSN